MLGEEKCKTITKGENKKIDVTCPICNKMRPIAISKLTERGYSCIYCSNKISYSENLLSNVLQKMQINYETQKTFVGGSFRYDFFLPEYNVVIETHGIQHYEQTTRKGSRIRTLQEEQKNDKMKKKFALENGILEENYHEIDCRKSNLEWCKPRIESVLGKYFNVALLNNEDWQECNEKSQSSIMLDICKYYEATKHSTKDIAKAFNIKNHQALYYLNKGALQGFCSYNGQDIIKNKKKQVIAINIETNEEILFESIAKVKEWGFHWRNIQKCLDNPNEIHKGFKLKLA